MQRPSEADPSQESRTGRWVLAVQVHILLPRHLRTCLDGLWSVPGPLTLLLYLVLFWGGGLPAVYSPRKHMLFRTLRTTPPTTVSADWSLGAELLRAWPTLATGEREETTNLKTVRLLGEEGGVHTQESPKGPSVPGSTQALGRRVRASDPSPLVLPVLASV